MNAGVARILNEWNRGEIPRYEVINRALDVLEPANVDEVVDSLPADFRKDIEESLRLWAKPDAELPAIIVGGSFRKPRNDEERRRWELDALEREAARERRFWEVLAPAARHWVARHPK
jgi:hypothetical protein